MELIQDQIFPPSEEDVPILGETIQPSASWCTQEGVQMEPIQHTWRGIMRLALVLPILLLSDYSIALAGGEVMSFPIISCGAGLS